MARTFKVIKVFFIIGGLLLLFAIPITGFISATANWNGSCESQSNQLVPCSWWDFAFHEMFWGLFLFIPFFFLAAVVWIGMSVVQFINSLWIKRSHKQNRSKENP